MINVFYQQYLDATNKQEFLDELKSTDPLAYAQFTGLHTDPRSKEYPSVIEQLDMLWHIMDSGEIPKSEAFYNSIKEIKTKYPKVK